MSKRLSPLAVLLLTMHTAAWGQTVSYSYWIDDGSTGTVTREVYATGAGDEMAEGESSPQTVAVQFEADVSQVSTGLHRLFVNVRGADGQESSTLMRYFLKAPANTSADSTARRTFYHYWIDGATQQQGSFSGTTATLDVSRLTPGLHRLFMCAENGNGDTSPVLLRYFMKFSAASTGQDARVVFWFDSNIEAKQSVPLADSIFSLDISGLAPGLHRLFTYVADERQSASLCRWFVRNDPSAGIVRYDYWLNNDTTTRRSVTLEQAANPLQLMTQLDVPSVPRRAGMFEFELRDGQAYAHPRNQLTMSFTNDQGLSADTTAVYTDMSDQPLTDVATLHTDQPLTEAAPTGDGMCWHRFEARDGDSILVMADRPCTLQLYGPDGSELYRADGSASTVFDGCMADATGLYHLAVYDLADTLATDITVTVHFQPNGVEYDVLTQDGILYQVPDRSDNRLTVAKVADRRHVVVPERLTYDGVEWIVVAVSDTAFSDCRSMVSVSLPATVEAISSAAFATCGQMAAVVWQAEAPLSLQSVGNPNLLVYVSNAAFAPQGVRNVVVDGICERLVLTDAVAAADGTSTAQTLGGGFYAPRPFTARRAEYSHRYTLPTPLDGCQGWETLVLPFTVQTIAHETQGEIAPFAALDAEGYEARKPFWLYGQGAAGFVRSARIEAYRPYLISMPYNMLYMPEYQLAGVVSFTARNAEIDATPELTATEGTSLLPALRPVAASEGMYALNIGGEDDRPAGSVFISGCRDVQPFQCYMTTGVQNAPLMITVEELLDGTTGIDRMQSDSGVQAGDRSYDLGGRRVPQRRDNPRRTGIVIKNNRATFLVF